jgi:Uma2 family endonuclease
MGNNQKLELLSLGKPMITERVIDANRVITGIELAELGDIGPCELVEGKIVPISPTGSLHGRCEGNFYFALRSFVEAHGGVGDVLVGEVGIYTRRNPDTVRAADVLFVSGERYAKRSSAGFLEVAPDLIVEILSPNDRWGEVMQKLREYFEIGVCLVWVADPYSRVVYAYRALTDVREFNEDDELPGDEALAGFSVSVKRLFEE